MSVCFECCVLSGRGLCDGPIPCPEESYILRACACVRVCVGVWGCVIRCNNKPLHLQRAGRRGRTMEEKK